MPFKETFTSRSSLVKQMTHLQNKARKEQSVNTQEQQVSQSAPRETTQQELDNKFMLSLKLKTLLHEIYKYGLKNCSTSPQLQYAFNHFMNVLIMDILIIEPALQHRGWSRAASQSALNERAVIKMHKDICRLGLFQMDCLEEQIEKTIEKVPLPNRAQSSREGYLTQGISHSSSVEQDLDLALDLDDSDVHQGPSY